MRIWPQKGSKITKIEMDNKRIHLEVFHEGQH